MSIKVGKLELSIRDKNDAHEKSIPTNARAAQKWVKSLPFANIDETSKQFYSYLLKLNESYVEAKTRFAILTSLTPTIDYIIEAMEKRYIPQPLARDERLRNAADSVDALLNEAAIGYNTIAEEIVAEGEVDKQRNLLAAAGAFSSHYMSRMQLQRYQLFKAVGDRLWGELNALYRFGWDNDLLHITLKKDAEHLQTMHAQYCHAVVMSVSHPYQLRPLEVSQIFTALSGLADKCEISKLDNGKAPFVVDLSGKRPPQPRSTNSKLESRYTFAVSTANMINALEDSFQKKTKGSLFARKKAAPAVELSSPLKRHLIPSWSEVRTRNFLRIATEVTANISVGLSASCFLLAKNFRDSGGAKHSANMDAFAGTSNTAEAHHLTVRDDNKGQMMARASRKTEGSDDVFSRLYQPRGIEKYELEKEQDRKRSADRRSREMLYQWISAVVINASPAGLCVKFTEAPPIYTKTNEIVSIAYTNDAGSSHVSVGTVKWMRWSENNQLLLGVELLAPEATPVRTMLAGKRHAHDHGALMLPELKALGLEATIVTHNIPYKEGHVVHVKTPDGNLEILLRKKLNNSENYAQFAYELQG